MLEHSLKLKAEAMEREKQAEAAKKTEEPAKSSEEEPMEEGTSSGEDKEKKEGPEYSVGEDGRPRQHILTDTGMLVPAG